MNMKNGILSGLGAIGLASSTPAYAEESLEDIAKRNDGVVVYVKEGTKLYHVASEFTRGNDNLDDGIYKTQLCDDYKIRAVVSKANNEIARLSAEVVSEAGMNDLSRAFLADNAMVRIRDGSVCVGGRAEYEIVAAADGLLGDDFSKMRGLNGKVPVVIPSKYLRVADVIAGPVEVSPGEPGLSTTGPNEDVVEVPAERPRVAESVYPSKLSSNGKVAGGYQYVNESGDAPLSGHGLWLEGGLYFALNDQSALGLNVRSWGMRLAYKEDEKNTVKVLDVDMSPVYVRALGSESEVRLGANIDARTAAATYSGIDAKAGQWAVGPEVGIRGSKGKFDYDASASLGWGNASTAVDVEGYTATEDALTKAKANAGIYLNAPKILLTAGLEAGVENDSRDQTTQDGGVTPHNSTRYTIGPVFEIGKEKGLRGVVGLDDVILHTQSGNEEAVKTNSIRGYAGVGYSW